MSKREDKLKEGEWSVCWTTQEDRGEREEQKVDLGTVRSLDTEAYGGRARGQGTPPPDSGTTDLKNLGNGCPLGDWRKAVSCITPPKQAG